MDYCSLERLTEAGKGIMNYFKDNIGKIEIMGKSGRMEKVYFEIESSRRKQWKDKQIVESRKHFLQTSEVGSSREKLESFINFCEDTIFEVSITYYLSTIKCPYQLYNILSLCILHALYYRWNILLRLLIVRTQ